MVLTKIFEVFFSIISLWELMSPRGMANWDPRGMVGRIYVGDHLTLLTTKYLSSGLPIITLRANEPRVVANLDPRGMVGRIYVGDHLMLLYIKYLSSGPHRETKIFLSFSHYKSMGDICCHGNQNSNPISPKILCCLSPHLIMLHMKFDQDWQSGIRDILI